MRIAVTGATGFIGRYIVLHLIREGHQLRCWYRPTSDRSGLETLESDLTWVAGDLRDATSCDCLMEGCDAVVHGALFHPGGGFREGEGERQGLDLCDRPIDLERADVAGEGFVNGLVDKTFGVFAEPPVGRLLFRFPDVEGVAPAHPG